MIKKNSSRNALFHSLFDAACLFSLVGIWPRFIEPSLLSLTKKEIKIPRLPKDLKHFKIVQLSDLHFSAKTPLRFINKIKKALFSLQPDLIVCTGDFICYGEMEHEKNLKEFLESLKAPYGVFAIFGNHDYDDYVSVNKAGDYSLLPKKEAPLSIAIRRIVGKPQKLTGKCDASLKGITPNRELMALLLDSGITPLHNECKKIPVGKSFLNICGLGELMAGHFEPDKAYANYDRNHPGLILSHNPDTLPALRTYPGDLFLFGHTHGGQINIPWIKDRFLMMERPYFYRGEFTYGDKWFYVNRGLSGTLPFRLRARPEILEVVLT